MSALPIHPAVTLRAAFALLVVLATLSAASLAPTRAHAQPSNDERAQAHFHAGTSYFDDGRFAESAQQFDEAYRLSQRATLLANASLAYERAGNLALAIERLEAYFAANTGPSTGGYMTSQDRLAGLRARLELELSASPDVPAQPEADTGGERAGPEDEAASAQAAGHGERSSSGLFGAGLGIAGAGVAMGVSALVLHLRAGALHRDLRSVCGPAGDQCPADRADDIARGPRLSRTAGAMVVGGGVGIALGLTLALLGRSRSTDGSDADTADTRERAPTTASLDITRRRVHLNLTGSF